MGYRFRMFSKLGPEVQATLILNRRLIGHVIFKAGDFFTKRLKTLDKIILLYFLIHWHSKCSFDSVQSHTEIFDLN